MKRKKDKKLKGGEKVIQQVDSHLADQERLRRARLNTDIEIARIALEQSIRERLTMETELQLAEATIAKLTEAAESSPSARDELTKIASQHHLRTTVLRGVMNAKRPIEAARRELCEALVAAERADQMPDAMLWALASLPVESETFKALTEPPPKEPT